MCTALTLTAENGAVIFGRTMDFSYPLSPSFKTVPAGQYWNSLTGTRSLCTAYTVSGITEASSPWQFADGMNDKGLAGAMLYFPGYACYDSCTSCGCPCIAAVEAVFYILGNCASVSEIRTALKKIRITGVNDNVTGAVSPLHWIFTDSSSDCLTVEITADGLNFYENRCGVLTNSPDFPWHLTNLRNYAGVTAVQNSHAEWDGICLPPFGQAGGTMGLPGDFTSPGRFVRTMFLKSHLQTPQSAEYAVSSGFRILGNVSIPKGCVITDRGTCDYTIYTVFYNLTDLKYYFVDNGKIPYTM